MDQGTASFGTEFPCKNVLLRTKGGRLLRLSLQAGFYGDVAFVLFLLGYCVRTLSEMAFGTGHAHASRVTSLPALRSSIAKY